MSTTYHFFCSDELPKGVLEESNHSVERTQPRIEDAVIEAIVFSEKEYATLISVTHPNGRQNAFKHQVTFTMDEMIGTIFEKVSFYRVVKRPGRMNVGKFLMEEE